MCVPIVPTILNSGILQLICLKLNVIFASLPPTSLLSNLLKQLFQYHYVKKEGVGVLPF